MKKQTIDGMIEWLEEGAGGHYFLTPAEVRDILDAFEELVRLQSHYATLLNMYDGGERHEFVSTKEWFDRLAELRKRKPQP